MKYVSVAEMVAIEQEANAIGISYNQMMENAGKNTARVIMEIFANLEDKSVLGLIGSGNNGGDTLVALSHLAENGWRANAYLVRPRPQNDTLLERLKRNGGKAFDFRTDKNMEQLARQIETHSLLLDGILGTGIRLPLKEQLAHIMTFINERLQKGIHPPVVIAVDCPSGVNCDSGEVAAECIPADLTVTMAAYKQGLLKLPAFEYCGEIIPVGIGLPDEGEGLENVRSIRAFVPDSKWVSENLPARPLNAHKGTFGTAMIIAGSQYYTGAAYLAGKAAYYIGTGLVTMAIPQSIHSPLAGSFPEATWLPLPDKGGFIAHQAAELILENLQRTTAVLIGPGFGLQDTTLEFLQKLLKPDMPPIVIDADGLKLASRLSNWSGRLPPHTILTPHPGEMSVLSGLSTAEIQAQRLEIARKFSQEWGHIVVLKGAFTVVAHPNGDSAVIPVATPALARAGTGDVLAGLIVGLVAQGVDPFTSATTGAYLHAIAGKFTEAAIGNSASVLAGDILKNIPEVISDILEFQNRERK